MKRTLVRNIKELVQVRESNEKLISGLEMKTLPSIDNAFLLIEDGKIAAFGSMSDCPSGENCEIINAQGKTVLPTWCDSHTHLVYAGNREGEFIDRINGLTYEEIAAKGGGILNSAKMLQAATEEELYQQSSKRLEEVIHLGTGAIEIKSGYGLTPASELKMLRVIKRLKDDYPIPVKATFLAAHALPQHYEMRRVEFITEMLDETLATIKDEGLADFIDVFCETGYFSPEETEIILKKGSVFGLKPKIHVNQFSSIGGIQTALSNNALTVDHLEVLEDEDLTALVKSKTLSVGLPGCSLFLGIPYTPVRKIIDAGLPIALATDFNPGSAPSGNMNLVLSLACMKMGLTPEEAINATTINGAFAMGLEGEVGTITIGKNANLIITKEITSIGALPYSFGSNLIDQVLINGESINEEL